MTGMPMKPCAKPGCPERVALGTRHCDVHARTVRQADDRRRGTAAQRGLGYAHQRQRERILRAEPLCRHCRAAGRTRAATELDHIIPRSRAVGGWVIKDGVRMRYDDDRNVQPLCHACHAAKSAADARGEGGQFLGGSRR